jgi:hypothetical protein
MAAGAALILGILLTQPLAAAPVRHDQAPVATDISAQSREVVVRRRPRTRIVVRPARIDTGIYPSPAPYNYPGPNAVRECDAAYVQEFRPSGTVIVPRMRCYWDIQR